MPDPGILVRCGCARCALRLRASRSQIGPLERPREDALTLGQASFELLELGQSGLTIRIRFTRIAANRVLEIATIIDPTTAEVNELAAVAG